ncbi:MAG: hypothetical protein IH595_07950 [Bacteroidales bacterium]|nr:hypothetical protein [Bacteroidales bacterium]
MKLFRTPNFKKRITDRIAPKKNLVNRAGLKMPRGYGWIRSPHKFLYNKVYHKLTRKLF